MESSKKLNTQGIGLGLFITKKIVQIYGGEIVCFSKFGHGSNFVLIVALDTDQNNGNIHNRLKNPILYTYPKVQVKLSNYAKKSIDNDSFDVFKLANMIQLESLDFATKLEMTIKKRKTGAIGSIRFFELETVKEIAN